ncbi:NAD(P)-dependent oxidoreductase, partial [Candidatus Parcubacteria bacterium]|nr:NAD(P)-dependent oxidoreductase [Candidatus Parcubacteria bacterium]
MKLLITGGTGKIGENLIKKLLQSNEIKIRVLVKKEESCFKDSKIEIIKGNLLDLNSLFKATKNIDIVLHLAGITHTNKKELYFKINTIGTQNLLKASEKNNVKKFIYISSRTACEQGGEYGQSKFFAEKNVQEYKNNWIILQLAEVYGAGKKEAISR